MPVEEVPPTGVTECGSALGLAHDVREQHGSQDAPGRNSSISPSMVSVSPTWERLSSPRSSTYFAAGMYPAR